MMEMQAAIDQQKERLAELQKKQGELEMLIKQHQQVVTTGTEQLKFLLGAVSECQNTLNKLTAPEPEPPKLADSEEAD